MIILILTYNQEIPESHIPKPKIYPVINDSVFERFSPIYKSVDIDKIESHQRSKGAKPSEKIKPQNSVRNLFFSINKYIK